MKKIRDYIHRDITCVNEDSSLRRVINTMKLHRLSALPVVNKLGEYVGCISEQEILNEAIPAYMKSMLDTSFMAGLDQITIHLKDKLEQKIIDFIDDEYPFVSPDDTMSYAADLLYRQKGTILPVVEGKTLIGLLTRIEILSLSLDIH
ncbi:CBS domain-containing protein [Carboxylicivirga sp. RSCT41]|uniref:CBS domain-containing protein n=1 Tax=Carboxylicivirga agarovorans TaxID=3417570 RepID=UPI003D343285